MDKSSKDSSTWAGSDKETESPVVDAKLSENPKVEKKSKLDSIAAASSSHTKYFRRLVTEDAMGYELINSDQYLGISEPISGSSDTFHCMHPPGVEKYTPAGLLKRNFIKNLDPIQLPREWTEECPPTQGWELAKILGFLVTDEVGVRQMNRIQTGIFDLLEIGKNGFRMDMLNNICALFNFLVEHHSNNPILKKGLELLLELIQKPVHLTKSSDILYNFDDLCNYIGFIGYLLQRLEEDEQFFICARGLMWQLVAPDSDRGIGTVRRRHIHVAGAPVLIQPISRMLALAKASRYSTFLEIALMLTCQDKECCLNIINEHILENMFYRFNPYFPWRLLPDYDIGPNDPQDARIKLGECSVHLNLTLSLLLVLLKTLNAYLEQNPDQRLSFPCPDDYAQRCYIWAFRYECRAREHQHERNTLLGVTTVLLNCFRERLVILGTLLMPDILSLSVLTELPSRQDWTATFNFNTGQRDVQFKKTLIHLSVYFIKYFPENEFMIAHRHWVVGLMYLLDPGLSRLRQRWSPALFAEIRLTAFQALVCALPLCPHKLIQKCGLIRRIMWYIEWYTECAFELNVLYWCLRLLFAVMRLRKTVGRRQAVRDLFDSHGVIIILRLCETLLDQKQPPVEKSQAIIALCLRMLTSSIESKRTLSCTVYPNLKWPLAISKLVKRMLGEVLTYLDKSYIVSYRWLVALLNFIWEGVVWNDAHRQIFLKENGVYKLLDLISLTKPPVQCMALAILCDMTRADGTVPQLITWRANQAASKAHPNLVPCGASIASLLAAVFRDDCKRTGVELNEYDVIQDMEYPIMSKVMLAELKDERFQNNINGRTPVCLAAGELAGSRMSKAYALLRMLSNDLEFKVKKADEAYNLYRNVKLPLKDEVVLRLCAHYLTLKLSETWIEIDAHNPTLLPVDGGLLQEIMCMGRGWARDIKYQQEKIISEERRKDQIEENSLYSFLGRIRLNIALDALRDLRCVARTADRDRILHALLHEAVLAHHRKTDATKTFGNKVLKTYAPPLDDQNMTGQFIRIQSISARGKKGPMVVSRPSTPL